MSCELCEKKNKVRGEWGSVMWIKNDDDLWFGSYEFAHGSMKVKYCPMCGRKLNEDK